MRMYRLSMDVGKTFTDGLTPLIMNENIEMPCIQLKTNTMLEGIK